VIGVQPLINRLKNRRSLDCLSRSIDKDPEPIFHRELVKAALTLRGRLSQHLMNYPTMPIQTRVQRVANVGDCIASSALSKRRKKRRVLRLRQHVSHFRCDLFGASGIP